MRMRRLKNYEAEYSRFDSPVVTYRDRSGIHVVEINAGGLWSVEIEVFRERGYTYVLSWNAQHPYVGIEIFLGHEPKGSLSLGKQETIEEVLGERGIDLTPMTMVKKLKEYIAINSERKQKDESQRKTKNN